jgi:hypothetical protein
MKTAFNVGDSVAVYHMVDDRSGHRYRGTVIEVTRSSLKVKYAYGTLTAWFWKQQCRRIKRRVA